MTKENKKEKYPKSFQSIDKKKSNLDETKNIEEVDEEEITQIKYTIPKNAIEEDNIPTPPKKEIDLLSKELKDNNSKKIEETKEKKDDFDIDEDEDEDDFDIDEDDFDIDEDEDEDDFDIDEDEDEDEDDFDIDIDEDEDEEGSDKLPKEHQKAPIIKSEPIDKKEEVLPKKEEVQEQVKKTYPNKYSIEDAEKTLNITNPSAIIGQGIFEEENWKTLSDYPRLVVISGCKAGQEFYLKSRRLRIGRLEDSDIYLRDDSVSRNHAEIIRDNKNRYILTDLGSLNSTKVNGVDITEHILQKGDIIKFGEVTCRFVLPGEEFFLVSQEQTNATQGPQTTAIMKRRAAAPFFILGLTGFHIIIIIMVIVGFGLVGAIFYLYNERKDVKITKNSYILKEEPELSEKPSKLLQTAYSYYEEGKWVEAKKAFEEIKKNNPTETSINDYLAKIEIEIESEEAIKIGKYIMSENNYKAAITQFKKVKEQSKKYMEAQALIKECNNNIINEYLKNANSFYSNGNYKEAFNLYNEVLLLDPNNTDATIGKERSEAKIKESDKTVKKRK